jgi:hypothetical protein
VVLKSISKEVILEMNLSSLIWLHLFTSGINRKTLRFIYLKQLKPKKTMTIQYMTIRIQLRAIVFGIGVAKVVFAH